MMKFSKKTKYVLLALLALLNIILRLPTTPHEIGIDSFHTHALANSISTNGYAEWILNPLSFFGLYPLSYPSGEIFFLSEVSQCTGVEMEWTIWVAATFFGVLGMFTSYLMAKKIRNDFLFAFSVAFIYSTSRMFIGFTTWTVSTRALFITILPLFIWSLLRCHNKKEDRFEYLLLAIGLLIILGTIHHLIFFTPLILIAFVISTFYYIINKKFNIQKLIAPKISLILFFLLLILLFLLPFTSLGFYHQLESFKGGHYSGYFFHGSTPLHIILNMGAEYAMATGILIALVPIGLILLLLKKQKTFSDVFLLAIILCFAPVLADLYIMFFVLFIFSLLIGLGLLEIIKILGKVKKVKRVTPVILIAILLFSALLPYFVVVRPTPSLPMHTSHMNEATYNSALFIKTHGVELPRISASLRFLPRINAIAGPPYQHTYSIEIDRMSSWSIKPISFSNFITEFLKYKSLYEVKKTWYGYFAYYNCDNMYVKQMMGYKTYLVIEDDYLPGRLPFYQSLRDTRPKVYSNGLESIWYLSY